jgi:hypothetical protein
MSDRQTAQRIFDDIKSDAHTDIYEEVHIHEGFVDTIECAIGAARKAEREAERERCKQWARWWAMAHDYHAEYIPPAWRRPTERKRAKRDRGRDMAYKAALCFLGSIEKGEYPEMPKHIKDSPLLEQFMKSIEVKSA